jgi:hypothetical protein
MSDDSNENMQDTESNKIPESKDAALPGDTPDKIEQQIAEEAQAKVVKSIEDDVAADAEKDQEEKENIPAKDFQSMDMEQLVKELEDLIQNQKIQSIKSNVEAIKKIFDSKFGALLAQKKATFLAEGGESIDFHYASPVKVAFNELMSEYKTLRNKHYADFESQLKENLNKRIEVIDALKALIEKADSATMYKEFKALQDRWKMIGPVPRTKYNNTWRNYHHHVERFYDLLHLNNDLRGLDFKHNLEAKLKIIEKAEALVKEEDILKSFKELQELHKKWKEDIGPVSREHREEVWQRFSAATKTIHDKRDAYYESQKSKYEDNIKLKLEVIQGLEAFDVSKNKTHSDWQKSIREFEEKREVFFSIGKVPRAKSQIIWDQLKSATKKFNQAKNTFYKNQNKTQQSNLEQKQKLVALAESLKESDDFEATTQKMKAIQADWKKIGHVPRKFSDQIWKQFKGACNHYFDRLHELQDSGSQDQKEALTTKKEFLSQIEGVVGNDDVKLEEVKAYIETWKKIGQVPRKEKGIESSFNKLIEKLFKHLKIEGEELVMLKYKMEMDAYLISGNTRKLDGEVAFLRKKIDELSKEIQQLDNNVSFISSTKEENPLVQKIKESIQTQTKDLQLWKNKLSYLRSLEL